MNASDKNVLSWEPGIAGIDKHHLFVGLDQARLFSQLPVGEAKITALVKVCHLGDLVQYKEKLHSIVFRGQGNPMSGIVQNKAHVQLEWVSPSIRYPQRCRTLSLK